MCQTCIDVNRPALSRRFMLGGLAAGLVAARTARAADPKAAVTPDIALKRLMAGHATYMAGKVTVGDYAAGRSGRSMGQAPIASILSCADSRVIPELVFAQKPGELFVVRVAGNVETSYGIASLEYGAKFLGVPLIMVMGHSACGAVEAAIKVYRENIMLPGHLPELIDRIVPSVKTAEAQKPADLLAASIVQNVRTTVADLSKSEPLLAPMVKAGSIKVVGSVYDIATGRVTMV